MQSKFASAERSDLNSLKAENKEVQQIQILNELLDALPYVAAILNEHRQILYSNEVLLKHLGNLSFDQILGKRPGEALHCENANNDTGGCGTTENCRYCGAVNAILNSSKNNVKTSLECRITSLVDDETISNDLLVTATPFYWNKEQYTILSISDISDEKRRKALEKIFFHDIINKAGSLSGYISLIKDVNDVQRLKDFLAMAGEISNELTEEILAQKQLLAAENNELQTTEDTMLSLLTIESLAEQWKAHPVAKDKEIVVASNTIDVGIKTDPVLAKRVLINMIKNALEASQTNSTITVGCFQEEQDWVTLFVNNPGVIPEVSQRQIFKRSFSTKGTDRGLGTYSMKLLGEKYLGGKVWFESNKQNNTTFFFKLPMKQLADI
jgi:signal transduction histidine kinase